MARLGLMKFVLFGTLTWGCADHASHTLHARTALDAGQPKQAVQLLDKELGVDRPEDVPTKLESEKVLLMLDRAMVLAQLERYQLASRDLEIADKQLEVLDFKRGTSTRHFDSACLGCPALASRVEAPRNAW